MKYEIYWTKLMLCSMISELENSTKKKEKKKVVNRDLQSRKWYQTGCAEFQLCSRPNSHTVYPHFHISFYSNILSVYIKQLWKKLHFQWVILNKHHHRTHCVSSRVIAVIEARQEERVGLPVSAVVLIRCCALKKSCLMLCTATAPAVFLWISCCV